MSTLNNALTAVVARKHKFVLRDVGVAGFNDHVNSLAYCTLPLTIKHFETYRRTNFAVLKAALNVNLQGARVRILRLRTYGEIL